MAGMGDRWLSVNETGKYLGVSSDAVVGDVLPTHRLGRFWKFKKDEAEGGRAGTWLIAIRRTRKNDYGLSCKLLRA